MGNGKVFPPSPGANVDIVSNCWPNKTSTAVLSLPKVSSYLAKTQQPHLLAQWCIINMLSIYRARLFHQGAQPQPQLFHVFVYLSFLHPLVSPLLKSLRLWKEGLSTCSFLYLSSLKSMKHGPLSRIAVTSILATVTPYKRHQDWLADTDVPSLGEG